MVQLKRDERDPKTNHRPLQGSSPLMSMRLKKYKKHMVLWDPNIVSNGMQEWLDQLQGGKSVQIFARPHENMQGWRNLVEQVQVDLFT